MKNRYNPISRSTSSPWAKKPQEQNTASSEQSDAWGADKPSELPLSRPAHIKQPSWSRPEGTRYPSGQGGQRKQQEAIRLTEAARARMELEALFSGKPVEPAKQDEPKAPTTLTLSRQQERPTPDTPAATQSSQQPTSGVTIVRKRAMGALGALGALSPFGGGAKPERSQSSDPRESTAGGQPKQGKTHTIIKSFSAVAGTAAEAAPASATPHENDSQGGEGSAHPMGAIKGMRSVEWPNPRVSNDIASARKRLAFMEPLQALAWLLLTSRADLKPMGAQEIDQHITKLLSQIDRRQFLEIKPANYWIVDPLSEIGFTPSGECERVRPVNAEGQYIHAHKLPGDLGAWVTSQRLSSSEAARRSASAQRINAISLAGLLIASDRFDVLDRFEPMDINPLMPAANLGFDHSDASKSRGGFETGEINGYAVGLVAHANHFFKWVDPWQELLREQIGLRSNEMTAALSLGLKTWSISHGELNQQCAEMTCTMLQLGAMISESGLTALCAQAVKSSGKANAAAGFARLCAQIFLMDRKGLAAQRVMQSAKAGGFSVEPRSGHAHPMVPYAQANMVEAVAALVREGLDPMVPDAMGKTVLQRAQSTRAERVVAFLEGREEVLEAAPALVTQPAPALPTTMVVSEAEATPAVVMPASSQIDQMDQSPVTSEPAVQVVAQNEPATESTQHVEPATVEAEAVATFAVNSRVKPSSRRRAAIEELRREFEMAQSSHSMA